MAVDDLADQPGVVLLRPYDVDRVQRGVAGHDREHAEPEIEHVLHLGVGHVARALDLREDPRLLPTRRVTIASQRSGSTRTRLPGMPPPVTCANACTDTSLASFSSAGA